ncbi:aldehyde dehydrogenase family protein [Aquimarina sp. W85]|uniref:aldehyde dehydrogenase family protein n=1 Tax=Aquimarina rhodophyticola TaxID=3342246 RepID=UPI00366B7322
MGYQTLVDAQYTFFNTNATKDILFRKKALKRLKNVLKENEEILYEAIFKDFKKSKFETYVTELALVYSEIDVALKNLNNWSSKRRIRTSLANFPAKSYIIAEPLGVSLVIGAWNYPYQLSLAPAVAALAAGCTVILKPSEIAVHTSSTIAQLINKNFDANFFTVIEGGVSETTELLSHKFDKIFFTGSVAVGKIIYKAAAEHLTPVTLELGGKSPAIISKHVHLKNTAKRLVWAKFLNAGQTCIAPDYVLVQNSIKEKFVHAIIDEIKAAAYAIDHDNYTQIIDVKNYIRLKQFISKETLYYGGKTDDDERIIYPTLLTNIEFNHPVMQEEIFGPILPIISYETMSEAIEMVKKLPKPLACYVFTRRKKEKEMVLNKLSFGGGSINDAIMHVTEQNLPFGGVGNSGMGNYHGKSGFDAFSHHKSILEKTFLFEPNLKYAPYSNLKLKLIKWLIK